MKSFYTQLLSSPKAREQYLLKLKIIGFIRQFFTEKGLLEIEAPILNNALIPESYLDVFETEERRVGLDGKIARKMYLMTSPESFSKKLLSAGFPSNFAITRSFRNGEPLSGKHLSEFSMLEWYEKGSNYLDVMVTTEQLFAYIAGQLRKTNKKITYNGAEINLAGPWHRISINELFKQFLSIDLEETWDRKARGFSVKLFAQILEKRPELHIKVEQTTTWEELYNQLFLTYLEPKLPANKPVIVFDYPHELSPLAKPKSGVVAQGGVWAERFEVMIGGLEMCDTYTENTDPKLQEALFKREIAKIEQGSEKTKYAYDWEFVEALRHGLPACSGNALGIDRVVMLFGNYDEILEI